MKEELYTIPVNEGFEADDECPFCAMERDVERRAIRYVVGPAATYMEPHVRAATGRVGFCGHHLKTLYDYRNAGAPWGNSQDALPRSMQKLQGLYPSDPPYKEK